MHPVIAAILTLLGVCLTAAGVVIAARLSSRVQMLTGQIAGEAQFRSDLLKRVESLDTKIARQDETIASLRERIANQDGVIATLREENRDLRRRLSVYEVTHPSTGATG